MAIYQRPLTTDEVYTMSHNELMHHGVKGMKWGIRRYQSYAENPTLSGNKGVDRLIKKRAGIAGKALKIERKSYNLDAKAAKYKQRAERAHARYDMGESNRAARRSAKHARAAAKIMNKSIKYRGVNESKRFRLEQKAAKRQLKSTRYNRRAEALSLQTGYGHRASRLVNKSDRYEIKAAKNRLKLAKRNRAMDSLNTRINTLQTNPPQPKKKKRR